MNLASRATIVYLVSQVVGLLVLSGRLPAEHADQVTSVIVDAIGGLLMIASAAVYLYKLLDIHKHTVIEDKRQQTELLKQFPDTNLAGVPSNPGAVVDPAKPTSSFGDLNNQPAPQVPQS